ncbi:Uncharacterised protein [Chlamydia abortus]|uniref:GapA-binding peptide SR1P n=2 Tax=Paenibacillus TaxID=44249 RepID=A0ABW3DDX0_9BACL|nr:Uncharacterised protein [Chlamydia abortus]
MLGRGMCVEHNMGLTEKTAGVFPLELGTILCRSCGRIIGTVPTEGVRMFYTECNEGNCNRVGGVEADE